MSECEDNVNLHLMPYERLLFGPEVNAIFICFSGSLARMNSFVADEDIQIQN